MEYYKLQWDNGWNMINATINGLNPDHSMCIGSSFDVHGKLFFQDIPQRHLNLLRWESDFHPVQFFSFCVPNRIHRCGGCPPPPLSNPLPTSETIQHNIFGCAKQAIRYYLPCDFAFITHLPCPRWVLKCVIMTSIWLVHTNSSHLHHLVQVLSLSFLLLGWGMGTVHKFRRSTYIA